MFTSSKSSLIGENSNSLHSLLLAKSNRTNTSSSETYPHHRQPTQLTTIDGNHTSNKSFSLKLNDLNIKTVINTTTHVYNNNNNNNNNNNVINNNDENANFFTNPYYNNEHDGINQLSTGRITVNKLSELYDSYKPDVGFRTGVILGTMLALIILYLLWRNRCKCICKNSGNAESEDYDLEYWLKHIDKQKALKNQQNSIQLEPQLPETTTDRKQATAAWVIQHRKLWNAMTKLRNNAFFFGNTDGGPKSAKKEYSNKNANETTRTNINSPNDSNRNQLFRIVRNPFRRSQTNNSRDFNSKAKKANRKKSQLFEELDAQTQLLINYARVDAITNVKFKKLFQNANQARKRSKLNSRASLALTIPIESLLSSDIFGGKLSVGRHSIEQVHSLLVSMRQLSAKRRFTWPRCKSDNLRLTGTNRVLRSYYFKQQKRQQKSKIVSELKDIEIEPFRLNLDTLNIQVVRSNSVY
jgi:hypothetical protein